MDYITYPNEYEFELATDQVIIKVVGYDCNITVNSLHDAYVTVKSLVDEGIICHIRIEQLFFCKKVYAMNSMGQWIIQFYQVWREVSIFNYRLEFSM